MEKLSIPRIAGLTVFWLIFLGFLAPAMISHRSYELPIGALVLAAAGAYATYRLLRSKTK